MRLLVYGGSFNPPHRGHVDALCGASEFLRPDRILVVPAKTPPHKELAEGSPAPEERLRLAELAFSPVARAEIADMEMRREGKSYTADTLEEIAAKFPGWEIYFLLGTDMLLYMEHWYAFRRILSLCTLAALPRNDGEQEELRQCAERLTERYGARIVLIPRPPLPMDSTTLRRTLCERQGREELSDEVYGEIIRLRLYKAKPELAWLRGKAYAWLKPARVPHVAGCEAEAVKLAGRWGADAGDAAEAGILHDITKKFDLDEQLRLCEKYGIITDIAERQEPKLLHAGTGAYLSRDLFGIPDEIFGAIRWHTTGRARMTLLEKIIYLADYIEPTRTFDGVEPLRRLAYEDLDQAMILGLRMSLEEVRRHGAEPHPRTKEALDWLLTEDHTE